MTRLESWSDTRIGTPVIVRRADGTTFETRTASPPFEALGTACIRVVSLDAQEYYALDRVSLARAGLALASPPVTAPVPLASARASESPAVTVANFVITAGTGMLCGLIGGVVLGYAMLVIATWGSR